MEQDVIEQDKVITCRYMHAISMRFNCRKSSEVIFDKVSHTHEIESSCRRPTTMNNMKFSWNQITRLSLKTAALAAGLLNLPLQPLSDYSGAYNPTILVRPVAAAGSLQLALPEAEERLIRLFEQSTPSVS